MGPGRSRRDGCGQHRTSRRRAGTPLVEGRAPLLVEAGQGLGGDPAGRGGIEGDDEGDALAGRARGHELAGVVLDGECHPSSLTPGGGCEQACAGSAQCRGAVLGVLLAVLAGRVELAGDQPDDPVGDAHRVVREPLVATEQGDVDGGLGAVLPAGVGDPGEQVAGAGRPSRRRRARSVGGLSTSRVAMTDPAFSTIRSAILAHLQDVSPHLGRARRRPGTAAARPSPRAARSPIRSMSLLIRMLVTMTRRLVATGCWRASRSNDIRSSLARRASISASAAITESARWMSASSRAVVARFIADDARWVISTSVSATRSSFLVEGLAHHGGVLRGRCGGRSRLTTRPRHCGTPG